MKKVKCLLVLAMILAMLPFSKVNASHVVQEEIINTRSPHSGTIQYLAVLIEFPDDDVKNVHLDDDYSLKALDIVLNGAANNPSVVSLKQYLYKYSYGLYNLEGHIFPKENGRVVSYMSSKPRTYYMARTASNPNGYQYNEERAREKELISEVLEGVKPSIEAQFSGSQLDVDNDGAIDAINFYVESLQDDPGIERGDVLGPHKYTGSFTTKIADKSIRDYNILNANDPSKPNALYSHNGSTNPALEDLMITNATYGTIHHEYLHTVGLPDYYRGDSYGNPVYLYDLMSLIMTNKPQPLLATVSQHLGWTGDMPEITQSSTVTLHRPQYNDRNESKAVKVVSPLNTSEYFVVEYYQKLNDFLPEDGALIYRVDPAYYGNIDGRQNNYCDEIYVMRPNESEMNAGYGNTLDAVLTKNVGRAYGKTLSETGSSWESDTLYYQNGKNSGIKVEVVSSTQDTITLNITIPDENFTTVYVTPDNFSIEQYQIIDLRAEVETNKSDVESDVTWSSSDENIARVDKLDSLTGRVYGVGAGVAEITATTSDGVSAKSIITVKCPAAGIELDREEVNIGVGGKTTLNANLTPAETTDSASYVWTSANTSIARVGAASGEITGVAEGTTTITVKAHIYGSSRVLTKDITVHVTSDQKPITGFSIDQDDVTLNENDSMQLSTTITPSDTSDDTNVTWHSNDENIATIDSSGRLVAVSAGSTIIEASLKNNQFSDRINVTVLPREIAITGITLSKSNVDLKVGESDTITYNILPENTTQSKEVTWLSNNPEIASVNNGEIIAQKIGDTTITVTTSNGISQTIEVHVTSNVDKTALANLITEASSKKAEDYTVESFANLTTALGAAQSVNQNDEATQEQVEVAKTNLQTALDGLKAKPVVDKTELNNKISEAQRTSTEGKTEDSAKALEDAIKTAQAVSADANATQEQVNEAVTFLEEAIAGLEDKPVTPVVDKTALEALISEALNKKAEDYTVDSFANLTTALEAAQSVNQNTEATQDQVDEAKNNLQKAIDGLVDNPEIPSVDKAALAILIAQAEGKKEQDYTEASFANLTTALTAAQEVNAKANATQTEVDNAKNTLEQAIAGLVDKPVTPVVDKTALNNKISEAQRTSTEGKTEDSAKALEDAIKTAQAVSADANATQEEVNAQVTALDNAIKALEDKPQPPVVDKSALAAKISEAQGKKAEDYTVESFANLTTALGAAQSVNQNDEATQNEVDEAKNNLQTALDGLKAKPVVDKTALNNKISEAQRISTEGKTEDSAKALEDAIKVAEEVNGNADATQEDVNNAITLLDEAIKGLVDKPAPVNKDALKQAITRASIYVSKNLSADDKDLYDSALANAKAVMDKKDATQGEVDTATKTLRDAIKTIDSNMSFPDVKENQWYIQVVDEAYARGLMGAEVVDKNLFKPDNPITRGMVATVLYRMAGSPKVEFSAKFPDVKDNLWYSKAIIWANQVGVVKGYDNGKFGVDDKITRQDLAIMLRNYAEKVGKLNVDAKADLTNFKDVKSISPYALPSLEWAVANKLISGKEEGSKVAPIDNATRAECAKMFTMLQDLIVK